MTRVSEGAESDWGEFCKVVSHGAFGIAGRSFSPRFPILASGITPRRMPAPFTIRLATVRFAAKHAVARLGVARRYRPKSNARSSLSLRM